MVQPVSDVEVQLAFSVYEGKGVFAVLLGSGVSRAADIPTGWEITIDLIRRVGLAQNVEEQSNWAEWYRKKAGQEPNYSTVLEELASTPEERRSILQGYIEPTMIDREDGRKVPTAAHFAIADLVVSGFVRVIVTTNFDRLLENALRERGIEPTIVASADALSGAEPITHTACYILKLHGDYKDARILNTDSELTAYPLSMTPCSIAFSTSTGLLSVDGRASGITRCGQLSCARPTVDIRCTGRHGLVSPLARKLLSNIVGRASCLLQTPTRFSRDCANG
jgi:hypothetical protein